MRVDTIRNYSAGGIAPKNLKIAKKRHEAPIQALCHDSVSFKSRASAGVGIGALFGVGALGIISALSGGLATPVAYGVYAATFGAAGGMTGNALDKTDDRRIEYD
jgi:hypothetical protein